MRAHPTGQPARPADELSTREQQVLRLVTKGLANKQTARYLGISESTVKAHISNVFRRIGVTDRTSASRSSALNATGYFFCDDMTVLSGRGEEGAENPPPSQSARQNNS